MDRVHVTVDRVAWSSPWWTSRRCGPWVRQRATGVGRDGRWGFEGSLVGARDDEGDEVKPRGCSPEHKRWRRGEERRWLELDVKAKWSVRELGREGKWCGEAWGCCSTFIVGGGHPGGGCHRVTASD
jgi:hypothetical protein